MVPQVAGEVFNSSAGETSWISLAGDGWTGVHFDAKRQ